MSEKALLLAMLFYLTDGTVKGITRLHKLVFLVQKEVGLGSFDFKPSKYGPWSPELEEDVRWLVSRGLIAVDEKQDPAYELLKERPVKIFKASHELIRLITV